MTEADVRLDKEMLLSLSNIVLKNMEREIRRGEIRRGCAEDIFRPPQAGSSTR
jgi:hypothetical protein